jgi:translocation and assembly module TamA
MRRFAARTVAFLFLTTLLSLGLQEARAADQQPYNVELKPTGDAALDAAVRDSSTLITLKDKAPVGGFALTQRARDDAARFQEAAHAFGYYNASVAVTINAIPLDTPTLADTIDKAPAAPPLPVSVAVDPGPRFHLGQIAIQGVLPPGFTPDLGIRPGQDAMAGEVLAARDRLLAALREASYPMATVILPEAVLHRDQQLLDVSFQVTTGPRAALGAIRFDGLHDMSESFMRRRLLLAPGQPFSPAKIEDARQDLLSLGVFSSVRVVPAEQLDAHDNLPLVIDVTEQKHHAVDLGAAYSTDLGVSLAAGWHHRNLFGNAEQLNITGSVQLGGNAITKPGGQLGAQFIKPSFLEHDQSLEISLNAVKQSLVAYDQTALIERIGITRKLSPHWSIQAGILGEEERITQEMVERPYVFVGLPVSLKYDSTKSLLDPTSGLRAAATITPVWSFVNPGGVYVITQLSGSGYFDLSGNGRSVLAMRGLVAQVSGGGGVFGLPPDQRLYAGGSATVRGYRYQSIGPMFADGKPTGGNAMSAGGVEFRQRFLTNWGAAVFVDAGQVSADGKPFSQHWQAGAGAGLRYYTVIGPIRLDVAVPLNRGRGDDSFELYIGIGQAF